MVQNGFSKIQQGFTKKNGKSPEEQMLKEWFKLPESVRQQTKALLDDRKIPVDKRMKELDQILKPYGGRAVSFSHFSYK
ncbi:unnamed protein product [Gongylonema pulchrum]|uniref:ATP-dependent DNA helicase n=1 Tax=Gongylonema pulchrum TaxID=637853 RepID=A0A183EFF3_9BILA|nr:unnamed protein product [Gongylonema pulchrum]